jgi:hypothetical protein
MKKIRTTIPAGIEARNATVLTMMAARVAPASGIKSRMATSRPSANAYGTSMISSTTVEVIPAMTLISRLPVT